MSFQCFAISHYKGSLRGDSEGEIAEAEVLQIEDLLPWPCFPLLLPECRRRPCRLNHGMTAGSGEPVFYEII